MCLQWDKILELHLHSVLLTHPYTHYSDVTMRNMASRTSAFRLFAQPFVQAHIKENIKAPLHVTGRWEGNPPVTDGFPSQWASKTENVSIRWRHHDTHMYAHTHTFPRLLHSPNQEALRLSVGVLYQKIVVTVIKTFFIWYLFGKANGTIVLDD